MKKNQKMGVGIKEVKEEVFEVKGHDPWQKLVRYQTTGLKFVHGN